MGQRFHGVLPGGRRQGIQGCQCCSGAPAGKLHGLFQGAAITDHGNNPVQLFPVALMDGFIDQPAGFFEYDGDLVGGDLDEFCFVRVVEIPEAGPFSGYPQSF